MVRTMPGLVSASLSSTKMRSTMSRIENIADSGREALNVGLKVLGDVVLVTHELGHVERRHVGEALPRLAQDKRLRVQPGFLLLGVFGEHGRLGRLQDAV